MRKLRTHLSFTQLRFHCSKNKGRTLHLTTAANSSGEAVVQYFSGQTDANPKACGSFVRMNDDNSKLAADCNQWRDKQWGYPFKGKGEIYSLLVSTGNITGLCLMGAQDGNVTT